MSKVTCPLTQSCWNVACAEAEAARAALKRSWRNIAAELVPVTLSALKHYNLLLDPIIPPSSTCAQRRDRESPEKLGSRGRKRTVQTRNARGRHRRQDVAACAGFQLVAHNMQNRRRAGSVPRLKREVLEEAVAIPRGTQLQLSPWKAH
jgi:hypothetical protein